MKHSLRLIYLILLATFLMACGGDTLPFNIPPTLTVSEATDIYRKGATISGTLTKANDQVVVETFGLYYATNSQLSDADSILASSQELSSCRYTINLTDLTPNTTYYYATFASSGYSIVKSEIRQFRTLDTSEPSIGALTVSNITRTSVDVSSSVLDDGGNDITIRGFLVREAPSDVSSLDFEDRQIRVETGSDFITTINELSPGTRYAICAYAMTAKAYGFSEIKYVTTDNQTGPTVSQTSAYTTNIAQTLYVTASIQDEGTSSVTECGFVYSSDTEMPTIENNRQTQAVLTGNSFTASITDLIPDQTNYIRAYAKSADGIGYDETFSYTQAEWPVLTTAEATNILEYSAQLNTAMNVNSSQINECGFLWSSSNSTPSLSDNKLKSTAGTTMTATLTGLNGNTRYYYRPYAIHSRGVSYGAAMQITTLLVKQADLSAVTVSGISFKTATFTASITALNNGTLTDAGFVYSTSPNPTLQDSHLSCGTSSTIFSSICKDLQAHTIYYVRAYATNEKGTAYSTQVSFTTKEEGSINIDGYDDVINLDQ